MIELAARSIGGLCSRVLSFSHCVRPEELILRHALVLPISDLKREERAAGVMMIPISRVGRLRAVTGLDAARTVPGVGQVIISIPIGGKPTCKDGAPCIPTNRDVGPGCLPPFAR